MERQYNLKNKHTAKTSLRVIHILIMPTCPRKLVMIPFQLSIQNIFTFGKKKKERGIYEGLWPMIRNQADNGAAPLPSPLKYHAFVCNKDETFLLSCFLLSQSSSLQWQHFILWQHFLFLSFPFLHQFSLLLYYTPLATSFPPRQLHHFPYPSKEAAYIRQI